MSRGHGDDDLRAVMAQAQHAPQECFETHILPPAAIGSRRSGLRHKFKLARHSLRLEPKDWAATRLLMDQIFVLTSNMGVESQLVNAQGWARDLFPHWCQIRLQDNATAIGDIRSHALLADSETIWSLRHVVHLPGSFHIVENIQSRLLSLLPGLGDIKPLVEHVRGLSCAFVARAVQPHLLEACSSWVVTASHIMPAFIRGRPGLGCDSADHGVVVDQRGPLAFIVE